MPSKNTLYGNLIVEIGRLFINHPYKAGTLEGLDKEKLIVNVSAFDCITFVETVLALARCAVAGKFSNHEFRKNLKSIRYRDGKINGYSSRLHYFTDWLSDNVRRKIVTDMSQKMGGEPLRKRIDFMTAHRKLYPALGEEKQLANMATVERNLSRKVFYIISSDRLSGHKHKIQNGDIIAFATNQEGLDVAHIGFAIRQGKSQRLLHASKKEGAVVISRSTLQAYLKSNKTFIGIIIARFSQHH